MAVQHYTKSEDNVLLENYYELSDKSLYMGIDFWERIRIRMRHENDYPERISNDYRSRIWYLTSLPYDGTTFEERYFDYYGSYYEDDWDKYEYEGEEEESDDEED